MLWPNLVGFFKNFDYTKFEKRINQVLDRLFVNHYAACFFIWYFLNFVWQYRFFGSYSYHEKQKSFAYDPYILAVLCHEILKMPPMYLTLLFVDNK